MALTDVADILKHDYKDLKDLLNDSVGICAQFDRNTDSIHGDFAVIALEVGREYGFGARTEGDVMPAAHSVPPKQVHVVVKKSMGRYRMTSDEIGAMESDAGAFARAQPRRMKNLQRTATRDYARQTWGDGAGHLATCGTTTATTTVQLAASTPEQALVNLAEGMQIDIGTDADPQLVAADRRVISVNFSNATIVISGAAVTTTSSHFLYRQGAGGDPTGSTQRELTGIKKLVGSGDTCQTLDGGTVWNWNATVDANGGNLRSPSENLLETVIHRHDNRSPVMINGLWAGDGVYRAMVNSLKGRQRTVNDISLKGGHTAIDYTFGAENLPLSRDKDATIAGPNSLWGIANESIEVYIQTDWKWEDQDGQVLRLTTDGTHAFEGIYYTRRELGVGMRNANLRIDDLETA